MKIGRICLTATIIAIVLSFAGCASYISPEDEIGLFDYPSEFFCESEGNRIDYQTSGKCAAYATAYLLRYFGEETNGEELYPELKRTLGFVSANSIMNVLEKHGYQAKTCHGSIDTLKQQLTNGNPIIVFIRIQGDTHYAVVVGYDERLIYLVDSLAENVNVQTNALDARYNRVLTMEAFEDVWKTRTLLPKNIYIVVDTADK